MDTELESNMIYLNTVVSRARQMRADYGLTSKQKPELYIHCVDGNLNSTLKSAGLEILTLTLSSSVHVVAEKNEVPQGCSTSVLDGSTNVCLQLKGILDPVKELQKFAKKLADVEKATGQLEAKMTFPSYIEKTPEGIKLEDEKKLAEKKSEIEIIRECIASMEALKTENMVQ